jgi:membrane associated rhomboid family serine protease
MDASTKAARRRALNALIIPFCFVAVLWTVHLFQSTFGWKLYWLGIHPGKWEGLLGIITTSFVHGGWKHLLNNSAPLLVLGWAMFYFYRPLALKAIAFIQLFSGLWIWLSARESYHIGASGLVYGLLAFIFVSGIIRREQKLIAISLLVTFLYGSMFWGVFPMPHKQDISWESHLMGAMAGLLLAFHYRREGPQRPLYQWEIDEMKEEEEEKAHTGGGYRKIVYHYRSTGGNSKKR